MRLLIDMNLSPEWAESLRESGLDAIHWSRLLSIICRNPSLLIAARFLSFRKHCSSGLDSVREKLGNGMKAAITPCPHEMAVGLKGFARQTRLNLTYCRACAPTRMTAYHAKYFVHELTKCCPSDIFRNVQHPDLRADYALANP